jgi:VWFA-related protein
MQRVLSPSCLLFLATVLGAGAAAAQQTPPQTPPDQRPALTFKTSVDLVAVDVTVIDRDGRPARDLTPADFVLTVDGKPRQLVAAQFISQTSEITPAEPSPSDAFGTNAATAPGRLIMLVIDQNNIRAGGGKAMIDAASRFIDTLKPADRIGLTVIPGGRQQVDFTANHALVKALLTRVVGRQAPDVGRMHVGLSEAIEYVVRSNSFTFNQMVERECAGLQPTDERYLVCRTDVQTEALSVLGRVRGDTNETLVSLRALFARLASGPEPKTVVLISEGLTLEDPSSQLSWVGPLAAGAHVSLYVMRLDSALFDSSDVRISATANEDQILRSQGLEILAGMARGASLPVGVNAERVFQRLALELSGYYLLSFEPQGVDRDGKPHQIKVEVRRQGLLVRARREFSVDTARATLSPEELLAETLRSPLLATEVPLGVTTYTFRDGATRKLKVLIAAEIGRAQNPAGDFALAFVLIDGNNKIAASQFEQSLGRPVPGEEGEPQPYTGAVLIDPGVYTLKLAVMDPEGRRGSVEYSFRAQVQSAGQLRVGDLMVAQVSPGPKPEVRPLVRPDVTRDSVHCYVELYSDVRAQLEKASIALDIAAEPTGRALETGVARLDAVEGEQRTAEGSVPVALLPPGSYVVRAVVSVDGRPVARVVRPFTLARALPAPAAETKTVTTVSIGSSATLAAAVGPFERESVLRPQVVGFFVDRMFTAEAAPAAPALRPLVEQAKAARFDTVAAELDRLDPSVAGELAPTFLRGLTLLARGDLEAAAGKFRESLRISSEFFPAVFYLGACYAAGGRDREAVGAWQTTLVTEEDAPFVYTLLGDALLRLNDGARALEILREARQLWPDNDDIIAREGAALAMIGQGREAAAILDPYFERHPTDHERLFLILRLVYEMIAAGRPIESAPADRARFAKYAGLYAAANGPQLGLVEEWKKFIDARK